MSTDKKKKVSVLSKLRNRSKSLELEAGVHDNVRLISLDTELRKDKNGKTIERHLFLRFKKLSKAGKDLGEKEIFFFMVDPLTDYAVDSLINFIEQCWQIVRVYKDSDEAADKAFNPLRAVAKREDFDEMDDKEFAHHISYEFIKTTVLKKAKDFRKVEELARKQMDKVLGERIGLDSLPLRLKLIQSKDKKYIQLPRYTPFIEKADVKKSKSILNY